MLTYSYGSRLAMAYRRRFSGRLRALVMDGPVDPEQPALAGHIAALETTLAAFLRDCDRAGIAGTATARGGPGCVMARRGAQPTLEAAEARFARGPLPAAGVGHTPIDRATFETAMVTLLADGNFARGAAKRRYRADGFNRRQGCDMIVSTGNRTSLMHAKRRCDGDLR